MLSGQFDSLAARFAYEGRIGGFGMFVVIGASYSDESSDGTDKGRIGIAGSLGSTSQWLAFESRWSEELSTAGVLPGDFHAVLNTPTQRGLSERCAKLTAELEIGSLCVTIRQDLYERCTTPMQRGWFGDAYGFARYVCFMSLSETVKERLTGDVGYYVEQGGKGFGWIMEHFGIIYRVDRLRASRRMAAYGPVDRRIHLPVHISDLVAHEVITNRHSSTVLEILGKLVAIDDINEEADLNALIDQWTRDQFAMNKLRETSRRNRVK